jgi:hypothetical protein
MLDTYTYLPHLPQEARRVPPATANQTAKILSSVRNEFSLE